MDWTHTYPSVEAMVPAIRAFVRAMLEDSPRRDDGELIASELSANSMRHTHSDQLRVQVVIRAGWARIAVTDSGSGGWEHTISQPGEDEESGRGLQIVTCVADKVGHEVDAAGQTVWAEILWSA